MRQIFGKSLRKKGGEFLVALKSRDFYSHEEFIRSERGIKYKQNVPFCGLFVNLTPTVR